MMMTLRHFGLAAFASVSLVALASGAADAQTCNWTTLTNGTTADADAVMHDLNCAALLTGANFTGNVGINQPRPIAPLDVAGDIHVSGTTTPIVTSQGAYLSWNALTGTTGETDLINNQGGGPGGFAFMNTPPSGSPLTTLMFINSAGFVGIGTTSPGAPLTVASAGGFGIQVVGPAGYYNVLNYNQLYSTGGPLYLNYSNTNNTIINSNGGNVGIGTTNPLSALDVEGQVQIDATSYGRTMYSQNGVNVWSIGPRTATDYYVFRESGSGNVLIPAGNVGIGTTTPIAPLEVRAGTNEDFYVFGPLGLSSGIALGAVNDADAASVPMELYASQFYFAGGNVTIGTTTQQSGYALTISGSGYASGGTWDPSDGRLKDHVATVTDGLALVEQLRPVRYSWLPAEKRTVGKNLKLGTDRSQIGFIAQEVEKVVPEAVNAPAKGSTDTYAMNESALIPVLTKAIQEQEDEIKRAQAEIAAQTSALGAQQAKIERLEALVAKTGPKT